MSKKFQIRKSGESYRMSHTHSHTHTHTETDRQTQKSSGKSKATKKECCEQNENEINEKKNRYVSRIFMARQSMPMDYVPYIAIFSVEDKTSNRQAKFTSALGIYRPGTGVNFKAKTLAIVRHNQSKKQQQK